MLDPKWLQALDAVVRQRGFDAASLVLGLTQSAVSQRIKSLEQAVGQPVLTRGKPPMVTGAGTALLGHYQRLLVMERDLATELPELSNDQADGGVVRLAVNQDSLASWFLDVPVQIWQQIGVRTQLQVSDEVLTLERLRAGEVMGAVSVSGATPKGCVSEPLGVMSYLAVTSPAGRERWFAKGPTAESLATAPLIIFTADDILHLAYFEHMGAKGIRPPEHIIPSLDAFHRAAEAGLGYCLAAEVHIERELAAGTLVPITPFRLRHPLFWHRWGIASPMLTQVSDIVRDAASILVSK